MGQFEDIVAWADENVFGNSDSGPASTVRFVPASDWGSAVDVDAVVIRDGLQGSNEVRGDGQSNDKPYGRSIRDSIIIEFLRSLPIQIQVVQDSQKPDLVKYDGMVYAAQRTIGIDSSMQAVLFTRNVDVSVKKVRGG